MTEPWRQILDNVSLDDAEFPLPVQADGHDILIFRAGGQFRAIQRWCPHQDADLASGTLLGNGTMIRCPRHGYVFRFSDGEAVNCRGCVAKVYEVHVEDGRLSVTRERTPADA